MARGIGARRSNELYGGLLGDYLKQAGGLLAERAGEVISGQALEEYIQSLFPGFGAYQIVDGQITFPEARAPQGGYEGLLGEMFGAGMSAPMGGLLHTVWHGSPHRWDVPDISKVGTGEGAQAYGHGFYSAESPEVARSYQEKLSDAVTTVGGKQVSKLPKTDSGMAHGALKWNNGDIDATLKMLDEYGSAPSADAARYARAARWLRENREAIEFQQGYLYKLDIPDEDIARYLDWDKPLSEQSKEVQAALREAVKRLTPNAIEDLGGNTSLLLNPDITGREILNTLESLSDIGSSTGASEFLNKTGIPGIRYLDGNSRGTGAGSYNYVTFDPSRIKVLERNGVLLP